MHEYSIAYDLYATAKKAALDHRATKVKKIRVDVGKMAMVNPEQVIFLFDTIKEDDPLFTATVLDCTEVEPAWCAKSFDLGYYRELVDKAWGEISFALSLGGAAGLM